jgi:hypothetical protein
MSVFIGKTLSKIKFLYSKTGLLLLLLFLFALSIRMWGISFGLPYEYHVDEVQYVRQAASMGQNGLEPTWWNNPPFYKYLYLIEYGFLYVIGRALGWYSSTADFGTQLTLDPTPLYLISRGTTAFLGALTVVSAWFVGKFAYSKRVAWLSAWFLAVCFIHVRDSHYAVNDIPVTLLIMVVLLACVRIVQSGKMKWYIVVGIALGLGFATKYSAAFAVIPFTIAHFLSPNVKISKRALGISRYSAAGFTALGTTIIASPYFLISIREVFADIYQALYLAGQLGFDGWQLDPAGGYIFYLKTLVWGLGLGLFMMSIVGIGVSLFRHRREDIVILAVPLTYFLMMGRQEMYFARFALPLIPAVLVLAAAATEFIVLKLFRRFNFEKSPYARMIFLFFAVLLTVQPFATSIRHNYLLTQEDTRTMAKEWIEVNIEEGAKIAVDWQFHGPPISTVDVRLPDSKRTYELLTVGRSGLAENSIEWYKQQGVDYLVFSSNINDIPLANENRNQAREAFLADVESNLLLVESFYPGEDGQSIDFIIDELYGPAITVWERSNPGPTIKIYQVNS